MSFSDLFRKKPIGLILNDAAGYERDSGGLRRSLTVFDLTALGIAAIVGSGIFATIGSAAASGGPAVALLFIFTAIACGFSALCYAEFASVIPLSGSAYTYAYASFGELFAWIIGWDLIIEYAIGNIAVAISWSDYFCGLMSGMGLHIPEYISTDYVTALRGYFDGSAAIAHGSSLAQLAPVIQKSYLAWVNSPVLGGVHLIANIPAFAIVALISMLVYVGIYETKVAGNSMVILKVVVLLLIIGVGSFYIKPGNWTPFSPHGLTGVLKGVSGVFFAYIGFDAISTTAEECRNTRRDLPRAIIYSLIITTILYVLISLVLTGMVNYSELGVGDPLAYVFERIHMGKFAGFISLAAIIAMASVILVFQVGQPRIWMSMSRDGLLPKAFSKIHPKFRTPAFATVVAGLFVAIPSLFINFTEVTDLTSIGTLFAFVLVSGGVLILNPRGRRDRDGQFARTIRYSGDEKDESDAGYKMQDERDPESRIPDPGSRIPDPASQIPHPTYDIRHPASEVTTKGFHVPYINSRYALPLVWAGVAVVLYFCNPPELNDLGRLFNFTFDRDDLPLFIFIVAAVVLTLMAVIKKLSLIPLLGLLSSLFLMVHLGFTNWMRFLVWLLIGMTIYILYSRKHSHLRHPETMSHKP
ncbi:MAG: amino acid permease [Bacteroidetes bacterium]|nr:amino acid permease [Bacteroidota bacterium]